MTKLDHFVWYPIAGKGYQDRPIASSGEFNPLLYTGLFKNEFIPIIVSYSKEDFKGYLLFNKRERSQLLVSCIFPRKSVDEHGRTGVFNHSAIVDRDILTRGEISLFDVESAMKDYDEKNPFPKDRIEQLEVPNQAKPGLNFTKNLKKYVSRAAVETLATRLMTSDKNRTIFRCLGASKVDRMKIAVYLLELLNFHCGIRPISFSTEVPSASEYYEIFDVLVLERAYPPETNAENWAVVMWDMDSTQLTRLKNRPEVYAKIDAAFG